MITALILCPFLSGAQRTTTHTNMFWFGYFNNTQLSKRFSVGGDLQLRTKEWAAKWAQQVLRAGLNYRLNERSTVTAGMAWMRHARYNNEQLNFINEWRPWQEVAYQLKGRCLGVGQRLRTEQRWIEQAAINERPSSYNFSFRVRYRLELQVPLLQGKVIPSIVNELMVNSANVGNEYFFDQNRTFIGVNIKASSTTTLQCQFMKIFQLRSSTGALDNMDVVRINISQQFNLNKK